MKRNISVVWRAMLAPDCPIIVLKDAVHLSGQRRDWTLIIAGGETMVEEARTLLNQFKDRSQGVCAAIDELPISRAEAGREALRHAARHLSHKRLVKMKLLLA